MFGRFSRSKSVRISEEKNSKVRDGNTLTFRERRLATGESIPLNLRIDTLAPPPKVSVKDRRKSAIERRPPKVLSPSIQFSETLVSKEIRVDWQGGKPRSEMDETLNSSVIQRRISKIEDQVNAESEDELANSKKDFSREELDERKNSTNDNDSERLLDSSVSLYTAEEDEKPAPKRKTEQVENESKSTGNGKFLASVSTGFSEDLENTRMMSPQKRLPVKTESQTRSQSSKISKTHFSLSYGTSPESLQAFMNHMNSFDWNLSQFEVRKIQEIREMRHRKLISTDNFADHISSVGNILRELHDRKDSFLFDPAYPSPSPQALPSLSPSPSLSSQCSIS